MSHRSIRKATPRRSLGFADADTGAGTSTRAGGNRAKGLVLQGLAALAISAVGLAVTASVNPDTTASASEMSQASLTSHAHHDHSHPAANEEPSADAFDRGGEDPSRGEVDRDPLEGADPAELQQILDEERKAAEERRAEEQRLAEERRAAEEAEKRKQEEEAAKAANPATTPMDKDRYSLGARWGAVGAWSRYHTGQDLSASVGTPIYAVTPGVVSWPNAGGWAGVHVVIEHEDGSSLYAHMATTTVSQGQQVNTGDLIGYVGMTGRTFGPHLHFEYYPKGASTSDPYSTKDPYTWLEAKGVRL